MTDQGKPTPTQAEQDAFARGVRHASHEPDGSPEDSHGHPAEQRLPHVIDKEERRRVAAQLEAEGFTYVPPGGDDVSEPTEAVSEETGDVPEKTETRKKAAEAEGGASYKTRQSRAEKTRKHDEED